MLLLTRASKRAIRSEVNAVETVKRKFTAAELQQYKKRSMFGEVWRNYKIFPMACNIQFVFYRKKGSDDILVKVLLNEQEMKLPVESTLAPYYHWKDVKDYWLRTVNSITLPACERDSE